METTYNDLTTLQAELLIDNIIEANLIDVFTRKIGIDYQVYDEVLEPEIAANALSRAYNWLLKETIDKLQVTVKVHSPSRFTTNELQTFFTNEHCSKCIRGIIEMNEEGSHPDAIAIRLLGELIHNDDLNLWFKGEPLGYNLDHLSEDNPF